MVCEKQVCGAHAVSHAAGARLVRQTDLKEDSCWRKERLQTAVTNYP